MIRRPPRSTLSSSSAASDVYKRQVHGDAGAASIDYLKARGTTHGFQYNINGPTEPTDPVIVNAIKRIKRKNVQFCDPDFDPDTMLHPDAVIETCAAQPDAVAWLRPPEFISTPLPDDLDELLCGPSRSPDCGAVQQGMCGDCWFISSLTTVAATQPGILKARFLEANPKLGYYVLCFWKDGAWREVLIDDRLMVLGGKNKGYTTTNLVYASTRNRTDPSEPGPAMWLPIIEKAYAKVHGGYPCLDGGHLTYGASDLTGGSPLNIWEDAQTCSSLASMFEWPDDMFYFMYMEFKSRGILALIGCSVKQGEHDSESENEVGLLRGHEYSLTRLIRMQGQPLLVEIQNPWGKEGEFKGDWSDSSSRWTTEMKHLANYSPEGDTDGKFCMAFKDFQKYFDSIELNLLYSDASFRSLTRSALSLIHISEPTRLLSISYAVFCLKKKKKQPRPTYYAYMRMNEKK
eukprot:TRINITY_DN24343_c0_g1_i1.p1 TRINITY_DN24343_c0_g1~~TRINITY_DN24343_c0_g1_i1.p1  ORF type:complete len:460 (+),score=123.93 TRINITY_DN24343_c0_g1_i1:101-1480(+)